MNWIIYLICWIVNSEVIIGIPDFYNLFELEEELLWALGMHSNNQGFINRPLHQPSRNNHYIDKQTHLNNWLLQDLLHTGNKGSNGASVSNIGHSNSNSLFTKAQINLFKNILGVSQDGNSNNQASSASDKNRHKDYIMASALVSSNTENLVNHDNMRTSYYMKINDDQSAKTEGQKDVSLVKSGPFNQKNDSKTKDRIEEDSLDRTDINSMTTVLKAVSNDRAHRSEQLEGSKGYFQHTRPTTDSIMSVTDKSTTGKVNTNNMKNEKTSIVDSISEPILTSPYGSVYSFVLPTTESPLFVTNPNLSLPRMQHVVEQTSPLFMPIVSDLETSSSAETTLPQIKPFYTDSSSLVDTSSDINLSNTEPSSVVQTYQTTDGASMVDIARAKPSTLPPSRSTSVYNEDIIIRNRIISKIEKAKEKVTSATTKFTENSLFVTEDTKSLSQLQSSSFRKDVQNVFTEDDSTLVTKEYKPATVEYRPLSESYNTVTPSVIDKTRGQNGSSQSVHNGATWQILDNNTSVRNPISKRNTRHFFSLDFTTPWPFLIETTSKSWNKGNQFTSDLSNVGGISPLPHQPSTRLTSVKYNDPSVGIPVSFSFGLVEPIKAEYLGPRNMNAQISQPLEARMAEGACSGCKMENGAGYNSHPTDCDKYVQCFFDDNGAVTAFYRTCPWGLYWNQDILSCQGTKDVRCKYDQCLNVQSGSYASETSCRNYWKCNGYSVPVCCPKGHAYVTGLGCVPDISCQDECSMYTDKATDNPECDKRSVDSNPTLFEQYVTGYGWVKMDCASGTKFSVAECSCSLTSTKQHIPKECKPVMLLEFNGDVKDSTENDVFVGSENVAVKDGAAYLNGSARLVIPQFTNAELGSNFGFRIRYKKAYYPSLDQREQSLINNGDCGDLGSVRLTIGNQGVGFALETTGEDTTVGFHIPTSQSEWTEVVYYISEGNLHGWVNGQSRTAKAAGAIEKTTCALQIGHGEGFRNFIGHIDEVEFFRCDSGIFDLFTKHPGYNTSPKPVTSPSVPQSTQSEGGVVVTLPNIIPNEDTTAKSSDGVFITMPTEPNPTPTTPYTATASLPPIDIVTLTQETTTKYVPITKSPGSATPKFTTSSWIWRTMPPIQPVTFFTWRTTTSSKPPTPQSIPSTTTTTQSTTIPLSTTRKITSTSTTTTTEPTTTDATLTTTFTVPSTITSTTPLTTTTKTKPTTTVPSTTTSIIPSTMTTTTQTTTTTPSTTTSTTPSTTTTTTATTTITTPSTTTTTTSSTTTTTIPITTTITPFTTNTTLPTTTITASTPTTPTSPTTSTTPPTTTPTIPETTTTTTASTTPSTTTSTTPSTTTSSITPTTTTSTTPSTTTTSSTPPTTTTSTTPSTTTSSTTPSTTTTSTTPSTTITSTTPSTTITSTTSPTTTTSTTPTTTSTTTTREPTTKPLPTRLATPPPA